MIRKIKYDNHEILKNLELNFLKDDGSIYNTILLIGENGTGKTTILNTLSEFLLLKSFEPFESIEYQVNTDIYKLIKDDKENAKYGMHCRINLANQQSEKIYNTKGHQNKIKEDEKDIRRYGVTYSKARSGYTTNQIKASTTEQLDLNIYNGDEQEDFTSIKQLIVDINEQDNSEWRRISEEHQNKDIEEFKKECKMARFSNAFNSFFEYIKFKNINNNDPDEKKIIFDKFGEEITIDQLSTGEKQIVFRGTYLLRNNGKIENGLILIDEPELSMHPKWQNKILKYYRDIFTTNGTQTNQMIFATHSDRVLKNAIEQKDCLILALKNENGEIKSIPLQDIKILPTLTFAEINYLAFDVVSVDYHIALYGYLQTLTQKSKINSCDRLIKSSNKYDARKYKKTTNVLIDGNRRRVTESLPTFVRNAIDHPDSGREYTDAELRESIEFLIELCKEYL